MAPEWPVGLIDADPSHISQFGQTLAKTVLELSKKHMCPVNEQVIKKTYS